MVNITKINSPAAKKTDEKPAVEKPVEKKEGNYDDGYGAPQDKTPDLETKPAVNSDAVPGVPGTHSEEEKKEYDDKYVAPKAEDKKDNVDEDMEECQCDKCGSKYKMKKAKKEDVVDKKAEEETVKKEYDDKYVAPKAEEEKKAHSFNFTIVSAALKPTKEQLAEAKNTKVNMNDVFGRKPKVNNSVGRQMNEWVNKQLADSYKLFKK